MSPPIFDESVSSSDELMILLKSVIFIEILFHLINFFSLLFWACENGNAWVWLDVHLSVVLIEFAFCFLDHLRFFVNVRQVIFTFLFVQSFNIGVSIFKRLFVSKNLERWRAILFICILNLFVFLSTHWHETDTWLDRVSCSTYQITHHLWAAPSTWTSSCRNCWVALGILSSADGIIGISYLKWFLTKTRVEEFIQMLGIISVSSQLHVGRILKYLLSTSWLKRRLMLGHIH